MLCVHVMIDLVNLDCCKNLANGINFKRVSAACFKQHIASI